MTHTAEVADHLLKLRAEKHPARLMVAIAGPPGSGKSTLADQIETTINQVEAQDCAVVFPMDGYHLDNALLDQDKTRSRKGSAPTFDFDGFCHFSRYVVSNHQLYILCIGATSHKLIGVRSAGRSSFKIDGRIPDAFKPSQAVIARTA